LFSSVFVDGERRKKACLERRDRQRCHILLFSQERRTQLKKKCRVALRGKVTFYGLSLSLAVRGRAGKVKCHEIGRENRTQETRIRMKPLTCKVVDACGGQRPTHTHHKAPPLPLEEEAFTQIRRRRLAPTPDNSWSSFSMRLRLRGRIFFAKTAPFNCYPST